MILLGRWCGSACLWTNLNWAGIGSIEGFLAARSIVSLLSRRRGSACLRTTIEYGGCRLAQASLAVTTSLFPIAVTLQRLLQLFAPE